MEGTRKRKRVEGNSSKMETKQPSNELPEIKISAAQGTPAKPTESNNNKSAAGNPAVDVQETPKYPKSKASRRSGSMGQQKPKTPKPTTPRPQKDKVWCSDCRDEAGAGCGGHVRVDLHTARLEAAAALKAAQATLHRLDELGVQGAPRLKCTAHLRGDEGEEEEEDIEVTLAAANLTADDKRALCAFLEGLELEPDEDHLSTSSAGCEAIATKCAKLPDRVDGIALKPGAVLLLGKPDPAGSDDEDADANASWLKHQPAMRIYYDYAVKPKQARGAKVLGYITGNLKHVGSAKPKGSYYLSGWGERYDSGMWMSLSNVKFVSD